jgi:tripartite-type tricarboxylate transporter receptor subunit TctC
MSTRRRSSGLRTDRVRRFLNGLAGLALLSVSLSAQAFPDRPIRIVLGFAPGGGSDILTRAIVPAMGQALGQQLVIDYKPGAGGNIAMDAVAKAAPDGYTLLMGTPGLATNASLYASLPFDPQKAFVAVGLVGTVQNVLVVNPAVPAKTVEEFVAWVKQRPDGVDFASPGAGTSLHLAAELFRSATGLRMTHVPYQGGAQAMNDVIGGQVPMMFNVLASALPQIAAGKLRALAVTAANRAPALPQVPTMVEAGVPGYTAFTWNGLAAPAGTPQPIVDQLNRALNAALQTAEVRERLAAIGQDPAPGTPADFARLIREETVKWQKVIRDSGLKAQ